MNKAQTDILWKALSDPTRRALLDLLREGPRTTGELCEPFRVSRFAVMKHLTVLRDAGLVLVRPEGRERWHYLNALPIRDLLDGYIDRYSGQWADRMLGLRDAVEGLSRSPYPLEGPMKELHIEQDVLIQATPEEVFDKLTGDVTSWWNHGFSESPHAIKLEPHVGGRFYEEFGGEGDGALYCTVTYVDRPHSLSMQGSMGMREPVTGSIKFELEKEGDGTRLKLSHHAFGLIDDEKEANYTVGWKVLLGERLKRLVETGNAEEN
ncbi:metalloregulator ArsR/SmtB family transcription factor [bacterium]|nr:metalloregulator ArsR/SmtB family transcription factor [bacterium]